MSDRRREFVHELAVFLAGDQAEKSIELEMCRRQDRENLFGDGWMRLRSVGWIRGYPTIEETERDLNALLGMPDADPA